MPSFRHKRTGKIVTVDAADAFRFQNARYELVEDKPLVRDEYDPKATIAEVLAYVEAHPEDRDLVLDLEKAGKNRKGIIEALT